MGDGVVRTQLTSISFLIWRNILEYKFTDNENIICTTNTWLEDQKQQFFYNGIHALEKCWNKCISVAGECWGDYVNSDEM